MNMISSFAFLASGTVAYYRNIVPICIGSILCLTSSLFYYTSIIMHSRYTHIIKVIDMFICQSCILYFILTYMSLHYLNIITFLAVLYLVLVYYILNLSNGSKNNYIWHSSIHLIANIGIISLIEAY